MNINQTTAYIGVTAEDEGHTSSLIKEISKDEKYNYYTVFLIFDLDSKEICFSSPEPFENESVYKYYYFGNNPGASTQYYLAREMKSVGYLLGTVLSDLNLMLKKHKMQNEILYTLLEKLHANKMIELADKQGKGTVNLNALAYTKRNNFREAVLTSDKKAVEFVNDVEEVERIAIEKIIRADLDDSNKNNKYALIVPTVRIKGVNVNLSSHESYLRLVVSEALEGNKSTSKTEASNQICYLCGKEKSDVSYEYTTKFEKSRINKIYTTTTINTAPNFIKKNYNQVYSICNECYNHLRTGEKVISEKFSGKLAGEKVFIIPEGIEKDFDYNNLQQIKDQVDFAFNSNDADKWIVHITTEAELMEYFFYTVNFIIYRTDGKSISVLQVIEDVPLLYFTQVVKAISDNKNSIIDHLRVMSLSSIYRIIPVRSNKKGEQIDIGRVLTLYKTLLGGGTVRIENLYSYAIEALDKGLKQLAKSSIDNYHNLDLYRYRGGRDDFFIKRIIMSYLVLIKTCRQFGILQMNSDIMYKGGDCLDNSYTLAPKEVINKMESFLNNQGFSKEARALFYLGALINRVAVVQLKKEHKTKPILKKISFQGMNSREVYQLYNDVLEKLRQYDKMTPYVEALMNKFHEYAGKTIVDQKLWPLSEQANVFYIMSGYAYVVGSKPVDYDRDEKQILHDINEGDNENNEN